MMYGEDLIFVTNLPSDFVGKLYVYEDINNTEVPIQTVDIVDGNARVNVSLDYGTHNIFARIIDYDETKYVFDSDAPDDEGFINPVPPSFTRLNGGKVDNSVDKEENISWQD